MRLRLDFHGLGSTTWKRQDVGRRIDADSSYCFDPAKVTLCRAADDRGDNDGAAFPIPDLAVGIDISPPKIDRPGIYSKLQIREVWRFGVETMSDEQLDGSGNYVIADASRFLFVRPEEVVRWLREGTSMARPAWKRAVREWARAELLARVVCKSTEPCVLFSQDLRPQTHGLRGPPPFPDPRGPQWSAVRTTLRAP